MIFKFNNFVLPPNMPGYEEKNMTLLLAQGNHKVLNELYDRYSSVLLGLITAIIGNTVTAEEVLQISFIKIWECKKEFDPKKQRLFTWIYKIARSSAVEFKNSESVRVNTHPNINCNESFETPGASNSFGLEERERLVLDLIYLKGCSPGEVVKRLDIPEDRLRSVLISAIKRIKERSLTCEM